MTKPATTQAPSPPHIPHKPSRPSPSIHKETVTIDRPETLDFPIRDLNRVCHAHYDQETVYDILDSTMFCHIAYVIGGQPYCTPRRVRE